MLGSVNPESLDTQVDEVVDVVGNLLPDVVLTAVQVVQADQVTVTDLICVIVVADLTVGLVEVTTSERNSGVFLISAVEAGSTGTLSRCSSTTHVVDDKISNNVDSSSIASADHAGELITVSGSGFQLPGNRLVPGPPLSTLDVLVGWGDLNTTESFWS